MARRPSFAISVVTAAKTPAFERGLHGGGKAQRDEAANAWQVEVYRSLQKLRAMAMVVPEKIADQHGGHVERAMAVDQPDPTVPMAGAPQFP